MCFTKMFNIVTAAVTKYFSLVKKNLLIWCLNLRKSFKKSMNFFLPFVVVIIFKNL